MPGFDGTGPMGAGPMTGWGRGVCGPNQGAGYVAPSPARGGYRAPAYGGTPGRSFGRGLGFRQGFGMGFGRGRGFGRGFGSRVFSLARGGW